ncbi:hypothetical protein [Dyadobacter chenhuakuii]|uniref:Uncharacterized protein n=1 Tax=Dyadobacter chenhuakuii TaxID=2909339 RepID=A0A9X1QAF0_9BACT|nr:hypothetical protein [Dyadobacter chenhuakuii]MCF2497429.1 hypothetical protein [Dyadobacter chenhuakuii]
MKQSFGQFWLLFQGLKSLARVWVAGDPAWHLASEPHRGGQLFAPGFSPGFKEKENRENKNKTRLWLILAFFPGIKIPGEGMDRR